MKDIIFTKRPNSMLRLLNRLFLYQMEQFLINLIGIQVRRMMLQQKQENHSASLKQLCEVAQKIRRSSSSELEQHLRCYINLYVQHKKFSEEFFICLCEHAILQRIFTAPSKSLPSLAVLQLFHLLISNTNNANDLVYIFSQPIVHEWLFQRFNIYKQRDDAIEYYVQLLKTIIMKAAAQGNQFLIKLFCNKRFPSFPLLTVSTVLGVSQKVDQLVRITAQQCVLLLINLINSVKTGLVYLNQLQMVVYFFELTRQMFCEEKNQDKQGSIKYFIDLACTLKNNKTSLYLLFNLMVNNFYFKFAAFPYKILRFIREFRQYGAFCAQFQEELQSIISTLFRIFCKYYCSQYVNLTYFHAQKIIPAVIIQSQPKLLKFFADRCRKIDEYLVNEGDYQKSQKGNECLIDEWLQFNNNPDQSPVRSPKKNAFVDFFSSSEDVVERYIHRVMIMSGLQVEKIKSPIIKLTFSSNFKTSLFLTEAITGQIDDKKKIQYEFCRDSCWKLKPSSELFIQIYLIHKLIPEVSQSVILLDELEKYQREIQFIQKIKPELALLIADQLCYKNVNLSKNYLLLLFKLFYKLKLSKYLESDQIQNLLRRLFDLQKMIGELMFMDESYPSFLKYILKNQERPFTRQKIDAQSIKNGKFKLTKPKQQKLEHLLFYYQIIQRYLDPSLKTLNEFVEEYWRLGFKGNDKGQNGFKALMACRDAKGNFLQVCPTEKFDFQIKYRSKSNERTKFSLRQADFSEDQPSSPLLKFGQYKSQIYLENTKSVLDFKSDINSIRQSRKQIFRQAVLEYMPFIYDSIEVKYRNHHPRTQYRSTPN